MSFVDKSCPACASNYIVSLQDIYLQRQQRTSTQYFCMSCQTFFHTSSYEENEAALVADTDWLVGHPGDYSSSIKEIKSIFSGAETCFEAGCGVGSLMAQLKSSNYKVSGIDPNFVAIEYARNINGVDAEVGHFRGITPTVDIIFAIDVLEHLEQPRRFFSDLVASVNVGGGIIIRVPTVDANRWHFLRTAGEPGPCDPADPFMDNSVHITHFSTNGLIKMGESLGARFDRKIDQDMTVFVRSV